MAFLRELNEEIYLKAGNKVLCYMTCLAMLSPLISKLIHSCFNIYAHGAVVIAIVYSYLSLHLSHMLWGLGYLPYVSDFLNSKGNKILTDFIDFGASTTLAVLTFHLTCESLSFETKESLEQMPLYALEIILFLLSWALLGMCVTKLRRERRYTVFKLALEASIGLSFEYWKVHKAIPLVVCAASMGAVVFNELKNDEDINFRCLCFNPLFYIAAICFIFMVVAYNYFVGERCTKGYTKTLFGMVFLYSFLSIPVFLILKILRLNIGGWWIVRMCLEVIELGLAAAMSVFMGHTKCSKGLSFEPWDKLEEKPLLGPHVIIFMIFWAVVGLCSTRARPPGIGRRYTQFKLGLESAILISLEYWTAAVYIPILVCGMAVVLIAFKEKTEA